MGGHNIDPRARPFLEEDAGADPLRQFERWYREAQQAGVEFPEAMALATTSADGRPSARMVLLKDYDRQGFVFFSGYGSRKGQELAENRRASLLFYWHPLGRQVRIEGTVVRVAPKESSAYFATRPRPSQLAAWASRQSEPIESRGVLESAVRGAEERFAGVEVPLPDHWGGYRLEPSAYEFWQHREDRLDDRLRYARQPGGGWTRQRLSP